jgi:peptidoglycan/xylan/chitin deacetylase (PgdA/CDA1 family)
VNTRSRVFDRHPGRRAAALAVVPVAVAGALALGQPAIAAPGAARAAAGTVTSTIDDIGYTGANRFAYYGSWRYCRGCRSDATGRGFHYATQRGASVRLTFSGTRAVLYGVRQRSGGIATVALDGRVAGTVNLAGRPGLVAVYATPVLRAGGHVVTLTVTGRTGRTIGIDHAVVTSLATGAPPTTAPVKPPATTPTATAPVKPPPTTPPATTTPAPPPPAGGGVASFTFDDGQTGQLTNGVPALEAAGFRGTFYIISDGMGWGSANLTAGQVAQLAAQGHEIGDHTRDHANLSTLSAAQIDAEFADSVAALKAKAGVTPTTCAYPYGAVNSTVEAIAAKYFAACRGTASGGGGAGSDRYDLTVFYLHSTTTAAQVRAAVDAAKAAGTWVILVYHGVGTGGTTDDVSAAQFADQVAAVKASGIRVATVSQALASR